VTVASAGLYSSLHLISDNHANILPLSFLQAGCPSCHPTNNVKALKAWQKYKEKLMNEENEWDHRKMAGVKEGPADCIRIDEVAVALKKRKRQSPTLVRASSRNDTSHRGYLNSVDTGFM